MTTAFTPVTDATLESFAGDSGAALLVVTGPDCHPCEMLLPRLESAAADYPMVRFGRADLEDVPELVRLAEITEIPLIALFRDGLLVHLAVGAMYRSHLDEMLDGVLGLDMRRVRRGIQEGDAAGTQPTAPGLTPAPGVDHAAGAFGIPGVVLPDEPGRAGGGGGEGPDPSTTFRL